METFAWRITCASCASVLRRPAPADKGRVDFCSEMCEADYLIRRGLSYETTPQRMSRKAFSQLHFLNEREFSDWFLKNHEEFGIRSIDCDEHYLFPDMICSTFDATRLRIELEYAAENFNHCTAFCDLVISFTKQKKNNSIGGVPVLSIFETTRRGKQLSAFVEKLTQNRRRSGMEGSRILFRSMDQALRQNLTTF